MTRDERDNILRNVVKSNLIIFHQSKTGNIEDALNHLCRDIDDVLDNYENPGVKTDVDRDSMEGCEDDVECPSSLHDYNR